MIPAIVRTIRPRRPFVGAPLTGGATTIHPIVRPVVRAVTRPAAWPRGGRVLPIPEPHVVVPVTRPIPKVVSARWPARRPWTAPSVVLAASRQAPPPATRSPIAIVRAGVATGRAHLGRVRFLPIPVHVAAQAPAAIVSGGPLVPIVVIRRRRRVGTSGVYLGRFQRGQRVPIVIDLGALDAIPVATIALVGTGATVATLPLPVLADGVTFRLDEFLGAQFGLGTYSVSIPYSLAGAPGRLAQTFDVVAGGDSGGPVISMYAYDRPESRYILAQLGAGRLAQGKNPRL